MMHVLVVDDDAAIRTAVSDIARNHGFAVSSVDDANGARTALKAHMADIVLLDLKLPGGGGLPLVEEIRTLYPETVVVVMTAYATVSSAVEAMRTGASEYLTKPFTMDELSDVLERASERAALRHRKPPAAGETADLGRLWNPDRAQSGNGTRLSHLVEGGAYQPSSVDPGRKRNRQGSGGPDDSLQRTERDSPLHTRGLRIAGAHAD